MFMSNPEANMNTISELPPADTYGSGTPVGGTAPQTTAMLSNDCVAITAVIPAANNLFALSFASMAVFMPENTRIANTPTTATHPISPNSSPITEKIKSLSANGR